VNEQIRSLLDQIAELDEQLKKALHEQESSIIFKIHGKKVEFDQNIRQAHRKAKRKITHWLVTDRPQNLVTGPIIYFMIIPIALLDLTVSLYQAICFPIYRIAKVARKDYIVFDRHNLGYLNFYERLHCEYCAYANGLLAYASEIVARTEQYFCPIKHARKVLGTHARYAQFLPFGEADDYHKRLEEIRKELALDAEKTPKA
jgi:cell division septum initiation protein DivIVA